MTVWTKNTNDQISKLILLADELMKTKLFEDGTVPRQRVNEELFFEFKLGGLALILELKDSSHPWYKEFEMNVKDPSPRSVERGKGILKSIKEHFKNYTVLQ